MINKMVVNKLLDVVGAGLCIGVGEPVPGKMCVEAAVCYALGEPHGDQPSCVGAAVRKYKITINDAAWSSNAARAAGMREIAVAQLGSNAINQQAFAASIALKTIQRIVPIALRAAAKAVPAHVAKLEQCAIDCENAADSRSAHTAAVAATNTAARAAGAAHAARAAANAARAAANAAANAADAADAARAAANAAAHAAYDADAARAARAATNAADNARDSVLKLAADIGTEVLKELQCEGTKWLYLCKELSV